MKFIEKYWDWIILIVLILAIIVATVLTMAAHHYGFIINWDDCINCTGMGIK